MDLVVGLKLVHILSVIAAVGSNVTYVFWLRLAGLDRDRLIFAITGIRWLDRRVANPLYVLALITGVGMVLVGLYSFETGWLAAAIALYVLTAILGISLFAPAVRRQLAEATRDPSTPEYAAAAWRTRMLALVTTGIVFVIVFLMVVKPF